MYHEFEKGKNSQGHRTIDENLEMIDALFLGYGGRSMNVWWVTHENQ